MTNLPTNLTELQSDYAVFLPALSTFYVNVVGNTYHTAGSNDPAVLPERIPDVLGRDGIGMDYLRPSSLWTYKWSLHSAGHSSLEIDKDLPREMMYRERDRNTSFMLGDSGGFQIGKGKWPGDWKANSGCPAAQKKRDGVLKWMDEYMDYGMILDVPAWLSRSPEGAAAAQISSYQEAADATAFNNEYFIKNRDGRCKFLNVLQGENHSQADAWYDQMKVFGDPKVYGDNAFDGYAMGGQNACDVHLILRRIVTLMHDGLLEKGKHDWMHVLGTGKLEWAGVLTAIQRGVRKAYNENFTISFDCASPFLATSNGQQYTHYAHPQNGKWQYIMENAPDNKDWANDTTPYDDYCSSIYKNWMPSPMTQNMQLKDICVYAPGDLNKIGKEGKTSWDSFSYALLMNHNIYTHIRSVQETNRIYDGGGYPKTLVDDNITGTEVKDVIKRIFEIDDRDKQMKLIDDHSKLWMKVIGSRGAIGKKTVNASTQFFNLFEEV
jgi:hypothetical protein